MDSNGSIPYLINHSNYILAGGMFIILSLLALSVIGLIENSNYFVRIGKILGCLMIMVPIGLRWFFSEYIVLWSACVLIALGLGMKYQNKFRK